MLHAGGCTFSSYTLFAACRVSFRGGRRGAFVPPWILFAPAPLRNLEDFFENHINKKWMKVLKLCVIMVFSFRQCTWTSEGVLSSLPPLGAEKLLICPSLSDFLNETLACMPCAVHHNPPATPLAKFWLCSPNLGCLSALSLCSWSRMLLKLWRLCMGLKLK